MELRPRKARAAPSTSVKARKPPPGNTPDFSASEKIGCKTRPFLESNTPAHPNGFEMEKIVAEACDVDEFVEEKIVKTERYGKEKEASEKSSKKKKKKQRDGSSSKETPNASSETQRGGENSAVVSETKKKKKKKKDETSRILFSDANEDAEALEMENLHEEYHKLVLSPSKVIYTKDIMDVAELGNLCGNDEKILEEEEKSKDLEHTSDTMEETQDLSLTSDTIQDVIHPIEENLLDVNGSRTPSLHKWSDAENVFNEEMKMQSGKNTTKKNKSGESNDLGPFSDKFDDQSIVFDGYTKFTGDDTLQYKKKSSNKKKKGQLPILGSPIDDEEADKNTRINVFDELETPMKRDWSDASKTSDKGRNTQPGKESAQQKEERTAIDLVGDTSRSTSHEDDDKPMHDSNTIEGDLNSYPSNGINGENIILNLKDEDQAIHGTSPMQTLTSSIKNTGDKNDDISSDEDSDAEEMAKIFAKSIKEYVQQTELKLSVIGTPRRKEEKKENSVDDEKSLSVMLDDSCSRLSSLGRIWCPETSLSSFTNVKATNLQSSGNVVAESIWRKEGKLQDGLVVPPLDPLIRNKMARKQKDNTAGAKWFNLSAPTITPELKKELQILKLRGVVDPKRHYKADDSKGLPKYFEVGTVIGGPTDFYSGRLTKKERKCSLADELLADSSVTAYRKRKYLEIQEQKQAGGKSFWKKTKSKRTPAWAKI